MTDARDELFEVLTGGGWSLAPGEADDMNRLIDNFAHELAEKIRRKCHDRYGSPKALRPGLWADEGYGLLDAADLIDPEVP